jgi:hypothetical protein
MLIFPWPGDDGQGNEHPPPAKALQPGSNHWHEATGLLDRARRAAIFCPIAVSRSGKKISLCALCASVVKNSPEQHARTKKGALFENLRERPLRLNYPG